MNRTEGAKGSTDGDGAGGSGQAVAEASDPVDDYVAEDLPKTFDDMSKVKPESLSNQRHVAEAEATERVTTRVDAGAFGKMRVVFK